MKEIKIGTRNSPLAIWQAREVARHLQNLNYITDIVPIVSKEESEKGEEYNDVDKKILTKDLAAALQNKEVDITVHSLRDIPLHLPENLELVAFLERDYTEDVLVRNQYAKYKPMNELKIAINDPRRKAQWLKEFPNANIVATEGNANSRLGKVESGELDAAIVSLARLKRLNLNFEYERLPFIISAPSQGVIVVLGRVDNQEVNELLHSLNDDKTQYCAENERAFQKYIAQDRKLPIGAFAELVNNEMRFKGILCSADGKNCVETDDIFPVDITRNYGEELAKVVLENGGQEILNS